MNQPPFPSVEKSSPKWPAHWAMLLALFLFLQSVGLALSIPRGVKPDEMAHIAYVRDAAHDTMLMPNYAEGEILSSGRKNYLGHPPLYYSALGAVARVARMDPVAGYVTFRIVSAGFVSIGLLFWLLAFRNLGLPPGAAFLGTLATLAVPMFGYVAGSVNNDTLAYTGAALVFYGLSRFKLEPESNDTCGIGCFVAGIIITFLTKATAAAFIAFFLAALGIMQWKRLLAAFRNRHYQWAATVIAMVCGGYYLYALSAYGSFFPAPAPLYAETPPSSPIDPLEFSVRFAKAMWERFPRIMSHASFSPIPETIYPVFYLMTLLPVVAWLTARPKALSRGADRLSVAISDAFVIALILSICACILITYKGYLLTGLYAGWQPRYFFFAIPAVWLIMYLVKPPLATTAITSAIFALCASISFWSSVPFMIAKQPVRQDRKALAKEQIVTRKPSGQYSPLSVSIPETNRRIAGHVDELKLGNGQLLVRGWAFDKGAASPIRRIWVTLGTTYIGSATAMSPRPDVARVHNRPAMANSGFQLKIQGIPPATEQCRIAMFAELADATLVRFRAPTCGN